MQWIKSVFHNKPLFDIGKLIITNDAMKCILDNSVDLTRILQKHQNGDWSHLNKWYQNSNRDAVKSRGYIVSSHTYRDQSICLITDKTRKCTTISRSYEVVLSASIALEN
jgi:hypothetical protein